MNLKKSIAACIAAAMGCMMVGSCSSDEPVDPSGNKIEKGEPSYAAFSLKMNRPYSKAPEADSNADPVEQVITSADVYIFSNGVLETKATTVVDADVTTPVAVTTGEKVVYAVASTITCDGLPLAVTAESTTIAEFEEMLFDAQRECIASQNAFVMIGRAGATITLNTKEQASQNPVRIAVDRASAKLQVRYGNDVTVRPSLRAGFGDAAFTVAQSALKMYIGTSPLLYTPQGNAAGGTYSGFTAVPSEWSDGSFKPALADAFTASYSDSHYMAESRVEHPVTGNVTFALIRLKVAPQEFYGNASAAADGTFYVIARNDRATATWIFASDPDYNMLYFATEADALAYKSEKIISDDYKVFCYMRGEAYYRVNLMNDTEASDIADKYCVIRNSFYRVNVAEVKALGAPDGPGVVPENPDTPIEQDSWLVAEISIRPWTVCSQDATLQ